jgi:hypothetical protein
MKGRTVFAEAPNDILRGRGETLLMKEISIQPAFTGSDLFGAVGLQTQAVYTAKLAIPKGIHFQPQTIRENAKVLFRLREIEKVALKLRLGLLYVVWRQLTLEFKDEVLV